MSGETPLSRLRRFQGEIAGQTGVWHAAALRASTADAVAVAGPGGEPGVLDAIAADYAKAATGVDAALMAVAELRRKRLPAAWAGDTHVAADAALGAAERGLERGLDALATIAAGLSELAAVTKPAEQRDRAGEGLLRAAHALADELTTGLLPDPASYDGDTMHRAHRLAIEGVAERVVAHVRVEATARQVDAEFFDLAAQARQSRLAGSALTPVDELLLTDAGSTRDSTARAILTAAMASRGAERFDALSEGDRARMATLLAGAGSAEQRAYLMRALAAGYDVDAVTGFNDLIAPYATDRAWLTEHLDPIDPAMLDPSRYVTTSFRGAKWTQGDEPTCVASATVTARARVDPVYALQLTAGNHPGDPAYDDRDAFSARLREEQMRVYDGGRDWYQRLPFMEGMSTGQSEEVADDEIGARTGADYRNRSIGDAGERRDVLPEIERAVDEGDAVPLSTRQGRVGHQLLVVGHDGDLLQIYNPWGYTFWLREEDFVDGHLDRVDPDIPDTPVSVRLPHR